ncbi:Twinfilin-1 [Ascosphaera acerosa]|nr:Twinfilin-1 [Ascosphaera acerosa]
MDVAAETLTLVDDAAPGQHYSPRDITALIPADTPQYTFYRHPGSGALLFIYTCPAASSIKARMVHASSRASVLKVAARRGLNVTHRFEGSGPEEVTAEKIEEEVNPPKAAPAKTAFARPRRPGR